MPGRVRIFFIAFIFTGLFASAVGRLFYLQVLKGNDYAQAASSQQAFSGKVAAERGNIYLSSFKSNGLSEAVPVALTRTWYNVWVSPKDIKPEWQLEVAQKLSLLLNIDSQFIKDRLAKEGDPYEPLKDKIDKRVVLELQKLSYEGVHWTAVQDRYYPLGELAAQVVGFVGVAGEGKSGQYGLERFYNSQLEGESGYIAGFKRALSRLDSQSKLSSLILPLSRVVKPRNGQNLYLTVDYNIQVALEKELKKAVEKFKLEGASGVIVDPQTGAVLAMAAWPSFNPNAYNEVANSANFLNPVVQLVFEPGSIFKPITMAAALDVNVISPDLVYTDEGVVRAGGVTIQNSTKKAWGQQTMTQVLEKSLNTGAIFALRRMPRGVWREYVERFGFSEKTGADLSGEIKGDVRNLRSGVELDWLVSSFGQGVAVTPLEMATAVGAIANGGELVKPYVVSKIIDNGPPPRVVFEAPRVIKRRVIKPTTANQLVGMMISVVENGSGRQARIPGYTVAGKTGTAQVSAAGGGGYTDKTIHTFVGFSPAFNPAFLMLIKLDNPQGIEFSEGSAAPVFKNVGEFILHYLDVPPDKPLQK